MQTQDTDPAQARAEWKAWEKATTGQTIDAVNALREEQGLTIKQLSVRLGAFGWPVDLATLNGILGSKKRASLSVGEIFVMARALSTTPLYLLLGIPEHVGTVPGRAFDNRSVSNVELLQWLAGYSPFPPSSSLQQDAAQQSHDRESYQRTGTAVSELLAYGNTVRAVEWHNSILVELLRMDPDGSREPMYAKHTRELLVSTLEELLEIRFGLVEDANIPLPPLPGPLSLIYDNIDLDLAGLDLPIVGLGTEEQARGAKALIGLRMKESRKRVIPGLNGSGKAVGYVPPA